MKAFCSLKSFSLYRKTIVPKLTNRVSSLISGKADFNNGPKGGVIALKCKLSTFDAE